MTGNVIKLDTVRPAAINRRLLAAAKEVLRVLESIAYAAAHPSRFEPSQAAISAGLVAAFATLALLTIALAVALVRGVLERPR